jgi:hypothetical protein
MSETFEPGLMDRGEAMCRLDDTWATASRLPHNQGPYGDQLMPCPYPNVTAALKAKLIEAGATGVSAGYSAGNDESWIHPIYLHLPDGSTRELETGYRYMQGDRQAPKGEFRMVTAYRAATDEADQRDMEIARLISQPIDRQYGSGAGDYDVAGQVSFMLNEGAFRYD